jgi:hypothetical protein
LSDENRNAEEEKKGIFGSIKEVFMQIIEELLEPPTISAVRSLEIYPFCFTVYTILVKLWKCSKRFQLMQCAHSTQIFGFVVGAIPWLKSFIIGENAPLHVIQETLQLLG